MATIQLTGDFGLDADVKLAPFSSLVKYFQQLPALRLNNADFSKAAGLTLDQPALTTLSSGLSFDKNIAVGPGATAISVSAGAHGSLELIERTPDVTSLQDVYSSDTEIAAGTCYVAFGVQASVGLSAASAAGLLQFGVSPGATVDIRNYQSFPLTRGARFSMLSAKQWGISLFPPPPTT